MTNPSDDTHAPEDRGRVRIWDKDWNCLVDEHAHDGDRPTDVINRAVDKLTQL